MKGRIVHHIFSIPAALFRSCPRIALQPTCYSDMPRKDPLRRYVECLYLRFRDGAVPLLYNALGLDVAGADLSNFVSNHTWLKCLGQYMRTIGKDYTVLLEDKYLFWMYFKDSGIPIVPIAAEQLIGCCKIGFVAFGGLIS